jgi:hypothetical protein
MFLRFRPRHNRLVITLVKGSRVAGKVCQQQIASLPSVGWPVQETVGERLAVWEALDRAMGRHELDGAIADRLRVALQDRVPKPTEEQCGAADLARAEEFRAESRKGLDNTRELIERRKKIIAHHQEAMAENEASAELDQAMIDKADEFIGRLSNYRGVEMAHRPDDAKDRSGLRCVKVRRNRQGRVLRQWREVRYFGPPMCEAPRPTSQDIRKKMRIVRRLKRYREHYLPHDMGWALTGVLQSK